MLKGRLRVEGSTEYTALTIGDLREFMRELDRAGAPDDAVVEGDRGNSAYALEADWRDAVPVSEVSKGRARRLANQVDALLVTEPWYSSLTPGQRVSVKDAVEGILLDAEAGGRQ